MTLTKLSLFSGIGGDDLASDWAGIETVAFCERDIFCQQVLKKHWPNIPIIGDVKDVKSDTIGTVDIVAGGFPCQPFSTAGKRNGESDDRYLWPEMRRIIHETKPTWVVGENVAGIITMAFHQVLSDLESEGYETQAFLIPACAVNAPHKRERFFVVAYSDKHRLQRAFKRVQKAKRGYATPFLRDTEWSNITKDSIPTPCFCRANDGIPSWVDRLKSLGNAVVPQQIYPIYKAIVEVENSSFSK